jgi:hypothetical protein
MTRPDIDRIGRLPLLAFPNTCQFPCSNIMSIAPRHSDAATVYCAGVFLQASFGVPLGGTVSFVLQTPRKKMGMARSHTATAI